MSVIFVDLIVSCECVIDFTFLLETLPGKKLHALNPLGNPNCVFFLASYDLRFYLGEFVVIVTLTSPSWLIECFKHCLETNCERPHPFTERQNEIIIDAVPDLY